ncbi:protein PTST homolog 3, chloroplastic [Silene latifolia]|uniref:protein PTST homolog 3, chloroplastic n=1 Tax=Silene latifolia TaxID=37657 RepID=UPI003D76EEFD
MAVHPQFLALPPSHHNYQNSNPLLSLSFHSILHPNSNHLYAKHSIVCLASSNKSRASRKLMSDEELRNCLKDFVSSLGLPHDHVPSTKQLSHHGRKDLANIVRRRGHKLIKELLTNATKPTTDEYDSLENLNGEFNETQADEEIGQEEKVTDYSEESTDLINDESPLDASLAMTPESAACSDNESPLSEESPVSLREKVENFMKYGQLDAVEDDAVKLMNHGEEKLTPDKSSTGSNGTLILQKSFSPPAEEIYTREIHLSTQSQQNIDFDLGMSSEGNTIQSSKMDNEVEIDRLKLMLHQKELELSRLKKDIEKEKEALSILQTKAEDEISKAQQLITEKEAELQVAEDSLSGLVEAKIYYSGEGQVVEVAGSFNGWHQRIKMDPQISSVIVDPIDSRKSRLWSATLWLYPGVYEMKFIVDGQWRIDPQREITLRHGVENNVLRVDR